MSVALIGDEAFMIVCDKVPDLAAFTVFFFIITVRNCIGVLLYLGCLPGGHAAAASCMEIHRRCTDTHTHPLQH